MNCRIKDVHSRVRRIGAWTSLLALLFVYAPMASATLMAVTGACCTGDQCPIHGNHHSGKKSRTQNSEQTPMECGHEGPESKKMQSCSMSCCHDIEQSAVHAYIFLPTPFSVPTALAPSSFAPHTSISAKLSPVFAPLGPPPKPFSN